MTRQIILDTETTGFSPFKGDRIIEVGALVMEDMVLTGEKFHYYINPERDVPMDAYRVHGISTDFLKDKPLFKEIAEEFVDFVADSPMVIHNAPFDIGFLNFELQRLKYKAYNLNDAIDTLKISRKKFPGARCRLDNLCARFKIDNSDRDYHGALKDAKLLAQVYVELMGGVQASFSTKTVKADLFVDSGSAVANEAFAVKDGIVVAPSKAEEKHHKEFLKEFFS